VGIEKINIYNIDIAINSLRDSFIVMFRAFGYSDLPLCYSDEGNFPSCCWL